MIFLQDITMDFKNQNQNQNWQITNSQITGTGRYIYIYVSYICPTLAWTIFKNDPLILWVEVLSFFAVHGNLVME